MLTQARTPRPGSGAKRRRLTVRQQDNRQPRPTPEQPCMLLSASCCFAGWFLKKYG
jgi:hypothetical protein